MSTTASLVLLHLTALTLAIVSPFLRPLVPLYERVRPYLPACASAVVDRVLDTAARFGTLPRRPPAPPSKRRQLVESPATVASTATTPTSTAATTVSTPFAWPIHAGASSTLGSPSAPPDQLQRGPSPSPDADDVAHLRRVHAFLVAELRCAQAQHQHTADVVLEALGIVAAGLAGLERAGIAPTVAGRGAGSVGCDAEQTQERETS